MTSLSRGLVPRDIQVIEHIFQHKKVAHAFPFRDLETKVDDRFLGLSANLVKLRFNLAGTFFRCHLTSHRKADFPIIPHEAFRKALASAQKRGYIQTIPKPALPAPLTAC